jgi:hypothetical protein
MNIRGVAKLLGDVPFEQVRQHVQVVAKINELLPDDQKITPSITGNELMTIVNSLPSVLQDEIEKVEVATTTETVMMSSDVRQVDGSSKPVDTTRRTVVLIAGICLLVTALLMVVTYMIVSLQSGTMTDSSVLTATLKIIGDVLTTYLQATAVPSP